MSKTDDDNCPQKLDIQLADEILATAKRKLKEAYTDAGLAGLCDEGRFEAALGALDSPDLKTLLARHLKS
jgi:hypothetical protein